MNKKGESLLLRSEMVKPIARAIVPRSLRNWIRSPSKSAEWLWDFTKFSFGTTKSLAVLSDWSVVCHPEAYRVFKQAQLADPEQREEFHSFVSYCSDRMFLFDIGAHFGIFSLATAHFGGRAIAVDPSPEAARMILAESTLNRCVDKIHVVQTAVGDSKGMTGMLSYGPFAHGYFMVVGGRSRHELTRTPTTTIDEMAHQFGMPTHIKIDVEGYEAAVLRGGSSTLSQSSPVLFLELHRDIIISQGGDPNSPLDELSHLGYKMFAPNGERIDKTSALGKPVTRLVAKRS